MDSRQLVLQLQAHQGLFISPVSGALTGARRRGLTLIFFFLDMSVPHFTQWLWILLPLLSHPTELLYCCVWLLLIPRRVFLISPTSSSLTNTVLVHIKQPFHAAEKIMNWQFPTDKKLQYFEIKKYLTQGHTFIWLLDTRWPVISHSQIYKVQNKCIR